MWSELHAEDTAECSQLEGQFYQPSGPRQSTQLLVKFLKIG